MKAALRFAAALLVTVLVHISLMRLTPEASRFVDLFLVVLLYHALASSPPVGMLYGLVAGLTADALSGGPYGLFGVAGTVAGFAAALISQLVVIQRSTGAFGLFVVGAATQQLVLVAVVMLTFPRPVLPEGASIAATTLTTGVLGMLLFLLSRYLRQRYAVWQRDRPSKIRFGR